MITTAFAFILSLAVLITWLWFCNRVDGYIGFIYTLKKLDCDITIVFTRKWKDYVLSLNDYTLDSWFGINDILKILKIDRNAVININDVKKYLKSGCVLFDNESIYGYDYLKSKYYYNCSKDGFSYSTTYFDNIDSDKEEFFINMFTSQII